LLLQDLREGGSGPRPAFRQVPVAGRRGGGGPRPGYGGRYASLRAPVQGAVPGGTRPQAHDRQLVRLQGYAVHGRDRPAGRDGEPDARRLGRRAAAAYPRRALVGQPAAELLTEGGSITLTACLEVS